MLQNFSFGLKTTVSVVVILVGVGALVLFWADRSANETEQKVQAQLQQAAQDNIGRTSSTANSEEVSAGKQESVASSTSEEIVSKQSWKEYEKPNEQKLQQLLNPIEYEVTQEDGTESAYENELWDETREGIYVDVLSGEPLFSSRNKYKSGTGWPSFTKPLEPENITTESDYLLGYRRTEVRSRYGDNHLGHVFDDGPESLEESGGAAPTGLRYCLNSAALKFIPKDQMVEAGYGEYVSIFRNSNQD